MAASSRTKLWNTALSVSDGAPEGGSVRGAASTEAGPKTAAAVVSRQRTAVVSPGRSAGPDCTGKGNAGSESACSESVRSESAGAGRVPAGISVRASARNGAVPDESERPASEASAAFMARGAAFGTSAPYGVAVRIPAVVPAGACAPERESAGNAASSGYAVRASIRRRCV